MQNNMPFDTLVDWVDCHAETTPTVIALSDGTHEISYAELKDMSTRLAIRLRATTRCERPLICIYQERSITNIVAMLAAMRAGGAYTVLEAGISPHYAARRLREIAPDVIVTDGALLPQIGQVGCPVIEMDGPGSTICEPLNIRSPDDLAYVLFTSGSTGQPKGVMVRHSNVLHYTGSLYRFLGISACLRYAHISSLAADLGNTSIFLALYSGGTLVLVPDRCRKDPAAFFRFAQTNRIDFLKITPSHWLALSGAGGGARPTEFRLHYLLLGGEVLQTCAASKILASGVTDNLVNHYGPTETTVGVLAHKVTGSDFGDEQSSIPAGVPFGQTRTVVIDADGMQIEHGCGELYIAGPSVSAGYLNNPIQTDATFVRFVDCKEIYYRTGDKVYKDERGLIYIQGRVDRQVKIGGYRVELDSVEAEMATLPMIKICAVEYIQDGESSALCAAVVLWPNADVVDASAIGDALSVPDYMRPKFYRFYDSLPLNKNGKVDRARIRQDFLDQLQPVPQLAQESADIVLQDVRNAWRKYLRFSTYTDHDSLFTVGGDSVCAIQIISDLQVKGYTVTTQGFLEDPTISGLHRKITSPTSGSAATNHNRTVDVRRLSAAQKTFFDDEFHDQNRWSQAFLLKSVFPLVPTRLQQVANLLMKWHPLLRTGYRSNHGEIDVLEKSIDEVDECFSCHALPQLDDLDYQTMLFKLSESLQQKLSIEAGQLFIVCQISSPGRQDHLLLIAHHLAVDAVSWRIIIDDLIRLYDVLSRGEEPHVASKTDAFWWWTQHLHDAATTLAADLPFWPDTSATAVISAPAKSATAGGEHEAETRWSYFSAVETDLLMEKVVRPRASSMDAVILAAFAQACGSLLADLKSDIAVESYGRVILSEGIDVTRTVGWFTSTFPLRDVGHARFAEALAQVEHDVKKVPHLGVAHSLLLPSAQHSSSRISYNYLGTFSLAQGEYVQLAHADFHPGAVRGRNRRQYDLTLTVKLKDNAVVLDCNFDPASVPASKVEQLLQEVRTRLLGEAGVEAESLVCLAHSGTTSGLLGYVPHNLLPKTEDMPQKRFSNVLLTGATGFIGCHLLNRLLTCSPAQLQIHCVVRGNNDDHAAARLLDAMRWYFPDGAWNQLPPQVKVYAGDITQENFGLSRSDYAALTAQIQAVYHLAADTRLFGGKHEFFKNNVDGLEGIIRFSRSCGDAEIHCMSTLAVAGINTDTLPRMFSEIDFDIGQKFNNNYEASKFESERRLNEYRACGGKVWIYRTGNVSGDSQTGRFQRNAGDNRFVQTIMALVRNGAYSSRSSDSIILSPVDVVAAGMHLLSVSPELEGGVYHIDSIDPISFDDIYKSLNELGLLQRAVPMHTHEEILLANKDSDDKVIALGRFWAQRPARHLVFNNAKTLALLERKGMRFPILDQAWLCAFFRQLDCVTHMASLPGMDLSAPARRNTCDAKGTEHGIERQAELVMDEKVDGNTTFGEENNGE